MKDLTQTSKFLALVLRHKPEEIRITLDEHGYAKADELLKGMNISFETLKEIVDTDNKRRYSFNEDMTLIRANQGHSIQVDVQLQKAVPPEILYHGTGEKFVDAILKEGLIPKSRLYVHLSKDKEIALNVGSRHGKPHVFEVKALKMHQKGFEFFLSENGVWLTKFVPKEFLK